MIWFYFCIIYVKGVKIEGGGINFDVRDLNLNFGLFVYYLCGFGWVCFLGFVVFFCRMGLKI